MYQIFSFTKRVFIYYFILYFNPFLFHSKYENLLTTFGLTKETITITKDKQVNYDKSVYRPILVNPTEVVVGYK